MSKTVIADILNNQFPPLTIEEGTFVVWRNLDPYPHSAETLPGIAGYFNAGALFPGDTSSPVLFSKSGTVKYLCRFHAGMEGTVAISAKGTAASTHLSSAHAAHDHHDHLQHFHGFVTGGSTAERLFMTHTPVLADERHHFQVILEATFPNKAHAEAYNAVRRSAYGDGKVQIFHDHLSLADIGAGKITTLPKASTEYYPKDPNGIDGGEPIPGLEENIPVQINKVLHFHQFEVDADYPESLEYIIYGDSKDLFIDHFMNRAPSFHSVAKLKSRPSFFPSDASTLKMTIPSKPIIDVSPKILRRVAFVDNSFHLFWLPPTGVYPRTLAQDPLIHRDGSEPVHEVKLADGTVGQIEIGRFLHFDVRLLNYGVLIT